VKVDANDVGRSHGAIDPNDRAMPMTLQKAQYRFRRFGERVLISSDIGGWMFLSRGQFEDFARRPVEELDAGLIEALGTRGFIVDADDLERETELAYRKYAPYFGGPVLFIIGVTGACNLSCEYCHANAEVRSPKQDRFSTRTVKRLVDFILDAAGETATVEFQGGEPLLAFDSIRRIVDEFRSRPDFPGRRIRFTLSSNLTKLDDATLAYLVDNRIQIIASIDGPPEIHDRQRPYASGRGSYATTARAFEKAQSAGAMLGIIAVATRHSQGKAAAIVDEIVDRSVRDVCINMPEQSGRALEHESWQNIGLSPEQCFELWQGAIEHIAKLQKNDEPPINEKFLQLILHKLFLPVSPNFTDWRSPCGATIGQISFDHEGNVYPCDEARGDRNLRLGNVISDRYADVIGRELTQEIIGSSLLENGVCDACVYKPFCGVCPVLRYKAGGEFESFRGFRERCSLFMAMFDYVFAKLLDGDDGMFRIPKPRVPRTDSREHSGPSARGELSTR
jgi:radical SAM protein with 4Fe4S-binding SPASM domain